MLHRGDRVRLTYSVADTFNAASHARLDWHKREGYVVRMPERPGMVTVKWDDRRTLDHWPEKALEHVPDSVGVPPRLD